MKFIEAVAYAYKNRRRDGDITTPTVFYSILSDLCGASYEDKKKLLLFFDLDKRYGIMSTLLNNAGDGVDRLTAAFCAGESGVSEERFNKLITRVSEAIGISAYKPKQEERQTVERTITYRQQSNLKILKKVLLAFGAAAIVVTCAILLGVFAKKIDWYVWQWIIGSGAGLLLTVATIVAVWKLDREVICDFYISGTVILGIFIAINTVLFVVFQQQYKIISLWICGYEIASGIFLCAKSFYDWENVFAFIQIGEIVATVALLLLTIFLV